MTKMQDHRMSSLLKLITKGDIRVLKLKPTSFTGRPSRFKDKKIQVTDRYTNQGIKLIQNLKSMQIHSNGKTNKHLLQKLITCAMACQELAYASISNLHYAAGIPPLHSISEATSEECFQLARQILFKQNLNRDTIVSCAITCAQCASECRKYSGHVFRECIQACETCTEACYSELYKIIHLSL
jgi:hypothetical protein